MTAPASPAASDAGGLDALLSVLRDEGAVWLPVNGPSLRPLLSLGDAARVERCAADALRPGDLALVRRGDAWAVRVVVRAAPLRTARLRGGAEAETGEVAGRVVAVRRRGRRVRAGRMTRAMVRAAHALLSSPACPRARSLFSRSTLLRLTRGRRARRLEPVTVRRLRPDDAAALDAFARDHLPRVRALLARQVAGRWRTAGTPVGAFAADGRMVGFVFVDAYAAEGVDVPGEWVRALSVAPEARRLRLGARLVDEACALAAAAGVHRVHADVQGGNEPSLRLLRALGFHDAPPDVAARARAVLATPADAHPLVVLRRDL